MPENTLLIVALNIATLLAVKSEIYQYGNGLWPRDHTIDGDDVTIVLRTDLGIPRDGNITGWSTYTNGTGNITFQIWRISPVEPSVFHLVGSNSFVIDSEGLQTLDVYDSNIGAKKGDYIGVHLPNSSILTYSVPKQGCPLKAYSRSLSLANGKEYTFGEADEVCMVLPMRAFIQSTRVDEQTTQYFTLSRTESSASSVKSVTSPHTSLTPEVTRFAEERTTVSQPTSGIQLVNGRKSNEGIVLVRHNDSGDWIGLCDENWNDATSGVVCKSLGYTGGAAKYFPFFGHWIPPNHHYLSVSCNGSETSILQCGDMKTKNISRCRHGHAAAVQCASAQSNDIKHVLGYPVVQRQHTEKRMGTNVVIPHPHHTLPWTSGTIRYWTFYLAEDMKNGSSMALQIWRKLDDTQYTFIGETNLRELKRGVHVKELTGNDERIHFEAGDVIGIQFSETNMIPYDLHPEPCAKDNSVDVIRNVPTYETLMPGQSYPYTRSTEDQEDCKMFSVFASYVGSERFGTNIFSLEHSLYEVITANNASWEDADGACAHSLGVKSGLVDINTEAEFSKIVGMLNSMNIREDVWIGNLVGSDHGEGYRFWAHCHPRRGETCVYLGRPKEDEYFDDSTDLVYMYTEKCEAAKYFLCEKSHSDVRYGQVITSMGSNRAVSPPPGPFDNNSSYLQPRDNKEDVISQKVVKPGPPSILIAPLTTAVLLFSCLFVLTAVHVFRKQRRKYSRDGDHSESTVRFVSLYDKAALSSMDC